MNRYYNLISAYLGLIILYVGYVATPANAVIFDDCANVQDVAQGTDVIVKANEWIPSGPKISVQVATKENSITFISIWAELNNDGTRIGTWTPIPGYANVAGCKGDAKATIKNLSKLNSNSVTYEWNPPSAGSIGTITSSPPSAPITASPTTGTPTSSPVLYPTTSSTIGSTSYLTNENKGSQEASKRSIPPDGSIVFKGLIQFNDNDDLDEIYSFTSTVIQMSNNNSTDKDDEKTPVINASVTDNKYPDNPPFSAANRKLLSEGSSSYVLIIVLTLATVIF
ncbi:15336_t:CDS:2 [Funneliformis caledonium]|uniref:15336_t:CDS:1 n=1 Tax=Funneliformis caledonium TaxID=1117310 RepID=A0A9N9E959_9GLOM|nr:15336_t:CDS:2 [Funneliformis caledonium]